jgi:diguanylate cyclase (GGDEF)-like protein
VSAQEHMEPTAAMATDAVDLVSEARDLLGTGPAAPRVDVLFEEPPVEGRHTDLIGNPVERVETAYLWDLLTDHLAWESNAPQVLQVNGPEAVATGALFNQLLAPEHVTRRGDAIAFSREDPLSTGVPYRLQFRFLPVGARSDASIWLEDNGRWWAGPNGKPARARGVLRVLNESYLAQQRDLYRNDLDELTGQLTRMRLIEALGTTLDRVNRTNEPAAVLMVAVNNLAIVNETFGFDVGDELIAAVGRSIKARLRGGDTIGRYSSNKFGVILNECGPGAARTAADRFMRAIRDSAIATSACQLSASIAIGGVQIPEQAGTVNEALSYALQALDRAKVRRTDCFVSYEPKPQQETLRRRNIAIADEVISALEEHRMSLALQPIVSVGSRETAFQECLLRLNRPDGTVATAGEFIAVAEQLGLSRMIDMRTLQLSLDLLKKHPELKLSLNVSGLTPNHHEWIVELDRLTRGDMSITNRLIVEITETSALNDIDQTIAFVDTLKELGCKVAIDDFGAGYTSFKNLKLLDVDIVKIDGSFIKNLSTDPHDIVFIRTLHELSAAFGMETVAEWVQDEASVELLQQAGITYMQGFYCGRPMAADLYGTSPDPQPLKAAS